MTNNNFQALVKEASAALKHQGRSDRVSIQYQGSRAYVGPVTLSNSSSSPAPRRLAGTKKSA